MGDVIFAVSRLPVLLIFTGGALVRSGNGRLAACLEKGKRRGVAASEGP